MSGALAIAALLTAGGSAFHASATRRVIGPLMASDLPRTTRWLAELCWHFVSLVFVVMAAAFAAGAGGWLGPDAIRLTAVLAAAIALFCGVGAIRAGLAPWRHPATYVAGTAAVLAFWASRSL